MSTVNGSPTAVQGRFGVLSYFVAVAMNFRPRERAHAALMFVTIAGLHLLGFAVFIVFVVPSHYKGLGIGVAGLAYTLGLRHAFDADHISAIDNTTRKLMNEGKRPLSIGFWFSLGHSTIVVTIGVGIVVAERAVYGAVSNSHSALEQFSGIFGTIVSATFLYLIALLNIVILAGILRVFRSMRHGDYDEAELERQLQNRGLMYRFFGRWMRTITREWQIIRLAWSSGWDSTPRPRLRCWPPPRCWPRSTCPLRDPLSPDPLHRRDVPDGHPRRHLHELRLLLGVLQPGAQGLLQPRDHRSLGRDLLLHRLDTATACVPLTITVRRRARTVRFGIGKPCQR